MSELELTNSEGGATLKIRAKTRADRNAVIEVRGDALLVAVSEPPEKGKANKAILTTLAKRLGVAKRDLSIAAGETQRDKRIRIEGLSARDVRGRLGLDDLSP